MDKARLFNTLVAMAAADGVVDTAEVQFLAGCADNWGIGATTIEQCLANVAGKRVELELPADPEQRLELLEWMLQLMTANGRIHPREMNLFSETAARMQISTAELDALLQRVLPGRDE